MEKGSCTPAVKRAIMEADLIDAYHWLPQDIKNIPYNDLQKLYIIKRQKNMTLEEKQILAMENNKLNSKNKTKGKKR
jgi:hypothetical protein